MRFTTFSPLLLAAVLPATQASAAVIQVVSGPTGARALTISAFDPFGQSFTAIDTNLTSFGFQFESLNPSRPNDPITFTLRAGEGLTGDIISSRVFTLPTTINSRIPTFFDFDITGSNVTIGQRYTGILQTTSSARNAVAFGPEFNIFNGQPLGGDAYTGGRAVFSTAPDQGFCAASGNCDLNFRVAGFTAVSAVPEPTTWAFMLVGFGAVGYSMRRKSTTKVTFATA